MRETMRIQATEREAPSDGRPFYGIDGPRRRPRFEPADPAAPLVLPEIAGTPTPAAAPPAVPRPSSGPGVRERWLEESRARALERLVTGAVLAERFDALREDLVAEVRSQVELAVGRIQAIIEREVEALRAMSHEEGKRLRGSSGEELVRVRASNTEELERIRTAIEDGIGRLCDVLEESLER